MSYLENQFASLWLYYYPKIDLHQEYRFAPPRRYRWDFCHPESKVAIEIQGGIFMKKSGHNTGSGVTKDYKKACLAAAKGWKIFYLSSSMITENYLKLIAQTIQNSYKSN
jgi:very-short-patch-repair endonuclease